QRPILSCQHLLAERPSLRSESECNVVVRSGEWRSPDQRSPKLLRPIRPGRCAPDKKTVASTGKLIRNPKCESGLPGHKTLDKPIIDDYSPRDLKVLRSSVVLVFSAPVVSKSNSDRALFRFNAHPFPASSIRRSFAH